MGDADQLRHALWAIAMTAERASVHDDMRVVLNVIIGTAKGALRGWAPPVEGEDDPADGRPLPPLPDSAYPPGAVSLPVEGSDNG